MYVARLTQWHANAHLARHTLFLVLILLVYVRKSLRQPAVVVIRALRGLSVTAAHFDAVLEQAAHQTAKTSGKEAT